MIDILARRRKNNPIVVGEAGVGKTAIVEGLALRIAANEVPPVLQGVQLLSLDMGLLQAGASVKGEFERRLKGVIDEVKASPVPIIVFIDEAHTLIGAGGNAGGSDAANLLKPALARGELRTIAATTWSEYKKYFEKDPALARRFQPVQLHEPTVSEAVTILRGLAHVYKKSHGIYLRDDAVVAAAHLSARYLAGRQLPDKAVDVLDTACARVRISLAAAPEQLERLRAEFAEGERQVHALRRDAEAGLVVDSAALEALEQRLIQVDAEQVALNDAWLAQRALAERLLELRQRLAKAREEDEPQALEQVPVLEAELQATQHALSQAHLRERLVSFEVCPRLVAEVVSAWTGVPLAQLAREHSQGRTFRQDLRARIRGQEQADWPWTAHACHCGGPEQTRCACGRFPAGGPQWCRQDRNRAGAGRSAVWRRALCDHHQHVRVPGEAHRFATDWRAARLCRLWRGRHAHRSRAAKAVFGVLLDEVEKADPDVLNLFYQIFDKGRGQ
jgi:type VI secretion system protein VasG